MDRVIVYPNELPKSADFLTLQDNVLYALGALASASVGTAPFVDGLPCTPGAGLSVNIGSGSIGQQQQMDAAGIAFGGLSLDTNTLMKIGYNKSATNIALTAPGTTGYSVNYLIEAQLQEADDLPVALPYYNSSNPAVPYTGPGNNGTSQNTRRKQVVALQLKAGAAATAGTQPTPGADSGWVPLWVVTVNAADSVVSATRIYPAPGAPFLGSKVEQSRTKLTGNLSLYVSTPANGGNDSANNGLSINTAFATIQAAANAVVNNYDLNGYSVYINVGPGSFAYATFSGLPTGFGIGSSVVVTGSGTGTATTLVSTGANGCINSINGANVAVSSLTLTGTNGLVTQSGSTLNMLGQVYFGALSQAGWSCGGLMYINGGFFITAASSGAEHFNVTSFGQIVVIGSCVCTLSGSPTFSSAFAVCVQGALLISSASGTLTFSGAAATGQRYLAQQGGWIATGGGGASYIPGSTAGVSTTGYYT